MFDENRAAPAAGPLVEVPLGDLVDGEARRFDVDGTGIAVIRIGDAVYAIADRCSHANYSLSEGEIDPDECTFECWKLGSAFSLTTGEPETLPATQAVATYRVAIVDGTALVRPA